MKHLFNNIQLERSAVHLAVFAIVWFFGPEQVGDGAWLAPFFALVSGGQTGCGNNPSTPFLYVKKDGLFRLENDVMFGKPSARFENIQEGIEAFKNGTITPDQYIIQSPLAFEDGKVTLQLREVEPEVSAIFKTSLRRLPVHTNEEVFVRSNFSGCIKVDYATEPSLEEKTATVHDAAGTELALVAGVGRLTKDTEHAVLLENGEYIDVTFRSKDTSHTYLLLESWYREWTMGDVYSESNEERLLRSPYHRFVRSLQNGVAKNMAVSAMAFVVGYIGFGMFSAKTSGTEVAQLARHLITGVETAYADVPPPTPTEEPDPWNNHKSLVVEVLKGAPRTRLEVVEPRYARPTAVAVALPRVTSEQDEEIVLRITATKRHKVSGIRVVRGTEVEKEAYETLPLLEAHHQRTQEDVTNVLSGTISDKPVHTLPADIVSLSFGEGKNAKTSQEGSTYAYVLSVGGAYAPASREDQEKAGDWVAKLDLDAQEFLSTLYYENKGKKLALRKSI